MTRAALVTVPDEWELKVEISPHLVRRLHAEALLRGGSIDEIIHEALLQFLRDHPPSWQ